MILNLKLKKSYNIKNNDNLIHGVQNCEELDESLILLTKIKFIELTLQFIKLMYSWIQKNAEKMYNNLVPYWNVQKFVISNKVHKLLHILFFSVKKHALMWFFYDRLDSITLLNTIQIFSLNFEPWTADDYFLF